VLTNENPLKMVSSTCLNMILLMGKVTLILIMAAPQPQANSKYSSRFNCTKNVMASFCQCQLIFSLNIILEKSQYANVILKTSSRAIRLHPQHKPNDNA